MVTSTSLFGPAVADVSLLIPDQSLAHLYNRYGHHDSLPRIDRRTSWVTYNTFRHHSLL